eukprot:NODE_8336_length_688_cov_14.835398_g7714_i0.p1 GENE.NODE_8336_length_688_cov_14.835398_g7714_i0~~NODE_8336_length_688_cov_14.835398_g7714_i0.p1  ORF type:complete len:181 (-),score=23.39 NODE_8336_length_688_cov_14.835398_g7714_i0:93-635(-)
MSDSRIWTRYCIGPLSFNPHWKPYIKNPNITLIGFLQKYQLSEVGKYHVCTLCNRSTSDRTQHQSKYHSEAIPSFIDLTIQFIIEKCCERRQPFDALLLPIFYTMETEIYRLVNKALRDNDGEKISYFMPVIYYVQEALRLWISEEHAQQKIMSVSSCHLTYSMVYLKNCTCKFEINSDG